MIFAWLEEIGYRRHELLNLTRRYLRTVLSWPRDDKGRLRPPPTRQRQLSRAEVLRRHFFLRGWPDHMIADKVREILAAESKPAKPPKPPKPAKPAKATRKGQSNAASPQQPPAAARPLGRRKADDR